jgi:hypothetical protein
VGCALTMSRSASADNFGPSHNDRGTNELIVTMIHVQHVMVEPFSAACSLQRVTGASLHAQIELAQKD